MSETEYIPKIAMSIVAHPDDQEFSIAGTLAKWSKAGCQTISVIVTDGDAGSNNPDIDASYKPELARIRRAEQQAANDVLGITSTCFLGYPDGVLTHTLELRKDLTRLIRLYKPDVVIAMDPTRRFFDSGYINHPDHRAAADAACDAVFPSAGTRLIFTDLLDEGLTPHDVKRLYLAGSEKNNLWIDISDTMDLKITALRKHVSQLGDWDPDEMVRKWALDEGQEHGMHYAEIYKMIMLVEDEDHG
jgi:LmbE family N-acetylglucosaminyl deacetylase